ncbi:hypothetical protein KI659_17920 [Litoribacter alkaliphilus]|uniref:Uncharacterized protein n=1 Tax=Litoribacter ruber TaxID=702568 RepID=A0AAP2CJK7_9BACT|nr:hypothetical protein [Litoribacter alkaliphilus]MBS9525903.1 hypothetical protein [Litoribacter alkaliphilus]
MITTNNTFSHDLAIGQGMENTLSEHLTDSTIEVKFDMYLNDRFFIEMFRKDFRTEAIVKTGLWTTKATHYALCKSYIKIIIETSDLKKLVKEKVKKFKELDPNFKNRQAFKCGGDGNRTFGILVTLTELTQYLVNIHTQTLN